MARIPDDDSPVLSVSGLTARYPGGSDDALGGVDLELGRGRRLAVVGGSGSGKSTLALALLGLLPQGSRVGGSAILAGTDLVSASTRTMARLRGDTISFVYQNPVVALDPRTKIGRQMVGLLRIHRKEPSRVLRAECRSLLSRVGYADPEGALRKYPHELSGGTLQRAMIALAVASRPAVLIADEPTTALDVTTQTAVLRVLEAEAAASGSALILITHNLALARDFCDDVLVLDRGVVVERGPTARVLSDPTSAVSRRLVDAIPVLPPMREGGFPHDER